MNERISQILDQITALEDDLRNVFKEQQSHSSFTFIGKHIQFEHAVKQAQKQLKLGVFKWFFTVPPLNYLTAPFIYGLIFPLILLDIWVTVYQALCFPIYAIKKCKRSDYIQYDHQHLAYLNSIEKIHCLYCSYASGLIAYTLEITARTEQYFCPIKHAHKILGPHSRYKHFLDYGEAEHFHDKLLQLRLALAKEIRTDE